MTPGEKIPLDLLDGALLRKRARAVAIGAVLVGGAIGGLFGLFGGATLGLSAAVIVALPLVLLAITEARRKVWLQDGVVSVRAIGTRRVNLRAAHRLELLITDVRGARTTGLLVSGPPKNKTVNIALATYAGVGGRELGILALRRLADVLATTGEAHALTYSELLVAQLRAEARGDAAADRPLYRLATLAPQGRVAQRLRPEAVAKFVTSLG
ncbi:MULTISPECIES: hypothetical protein [unclassified Crossiella]|uniref:hypothetical protein n=1 Tax=unclassified Crossiella TaxID=2620835 RepID=UPI001FFF9645|nr:MULTISPECIES: hypothetical protein [unclassified Crossiella]MCK2239423.1 hypothetical protein [Crossiella sp. S99.2]MCK2252118.1 hypothetical protein [Crossiella sp. S99.1]